MARLPLASTHLRNSRLCDLQHETLDYATSRREGSAHKVVVISASRGCLQDGARPAMRSRGWARGGHALTAASLNTAARARRR